MKKYLLLFLMCVYASIGAWAIPVTFGEGNSTYEDNGGGSFTVTVNKKGDIASQEAYDKWQWGANAPWNSATKIILKLGAGVSLSELGQGGSNDLYLLVENTSVTTVDVSNISDISGIKDLSDNFKKQFNNLIISSTLSNNLSSYIFGTVTNVFSVSSNTLNAYITDLSKINKLDDVKGSCTELAVAAGSTPTDYSSVSFTTFDFTGLTPISSDITVPTGATVKVATPEDKEHIKGTDPTNVIVYFDGNLNVAGNGSLDSNISTALTPYGATKSDIVNLTVTGSLTAEDVACLSSLTSLSTLDLTGVTFGAGVTKASVAAAVRTGVTVQYPASYTITDGCKVTIDMSKAMGDNLATILAAAKTALGSTNICTLIVTGPVTNNDLIALGGTNMTGATRIDLSGATLASGVNLDYLQVPSSLVSLVLPKDQTFSVGLKSKLTAATNLKYAYTPSSDCTATGPNQADESKAEYKYDDTKNTIADYVWVNKAGGLAEALENEEQLRNSFYIKVASGVALTTTDINFGALNNKPTNYLFLDLSESIMTPTVADSYTVEDDIPYRIILPNNWSNDDLAHFQNNTNKGNLAAVYSYEDTKLNILVIEDNSYWGTALQNPRIVRTGTNAIDILPGAYTNNHEFGTATTEGRGIITAINSADPDIKSVYISIANTGNNYNLTYSFSNPNITYLNFDGLKSAYGTGPNVNVSGCTSLQTLDVKNADIFSLDAHNINSLTSVNLTGTKITGATNLSGTGLRTFTTNSSTDFQGALNLTSTAITSFATQAKVTGDISLNACSSLTSVDISSTQFQNTGSMIHIDKDSEEGTKAIENLDRSVSGTAVKTIMVPNGFSSSTRIHPYDDVADNIGATAAGGGLSDGDGCTITYNATTKVATVHATTAGHFANIMASNYSSFPIGTTFKFDSESVINENDLKALAGYIKKTDNTEADYNWRTNYYYVDLYDLPATEELCDYENGTITDVINWLRTNDRQFKGLILPKDHTLYGAGISLIQSEKPKTQGELSTCSEFIAYFKTKDMVNNVETNLPKKILFTHVYNQTATNSEGIQASNDKLTELLTAHGLNGAAENCPVDLYSVSTNGTTPFNATALVGSKGYVETFNNEMVGPDTRANIYAYPSAAGEFTTFVNYSSIGVTTTEVMKIDGTVSSDASAVAASINRFTNGPRVLDLKEIEPNSDEFLSALLPALTNSNIEYIILPEGKSKELVCNTTYSTSMTKLKAVISSSNTDLVAYVKQAGSLAEARYLATGGSVDANTHMITPAQTGLQSVTLAGNLNAADIAANTTTHHVDASGHWVSGGANATSIALSSEQGTITTIDLKDAVFDEYTPTGGKLTSDMNFSYAGLGSIRNITLPTSEDMTLIPEDCFMGITSFNDLCIPYNYTKIDNKALYGTYCGHITTTDALNGAVVDNGEHSYTFSANLEEIGSKPSTADANGVYSLSETVFPQNRGVTDVYVLAHKVPKCYANAFPANMLYGWGGFKGGDFPYCREKYENGSDGSMIFTVLHYPDEASYAKSSDKTGPTYEEMEKLYTDINKVYSKKEQTGAVDANGDPIAWPTFAELRRAYNQATDGITWNDWTLEKDGNGEVLGGSQIPTAKNAVAEGPKTNTYPFENYEGWHQFVLSMATYVEPAKTVENEIIKTDYVQGAWYTLCIPFSLTLDQAIEILGIPKSVEGKTENSLNGKKVEVDYLPDVRTLQTVTRTPGTTNTVTMKFTQNLLADGLTRYWTINYSDPGQSNYSQGTSSGNSIAIRGGYPYLIRPYLPANEVVKNLGKYIMTRYGDKFEQTRSCIYIDGCAQDLAPYSSTQKTGRFAKPFENHKIQAAWDDNDSSTQEYRTHSDGKNYNYTFVGQFWDQKLPRYCFYMVENSDNTAGKWYRLASGDKDYKWNQYKCVIMVTPEVDDPYPGDRSYLYTNSGKFRNNDQNATTHSIYPASIGKDAQGAYKFEGQLYIEFLNGLDDADFTEAARAKYVFAFDDFIQEFDENGNSTTSIDSIDGSAVNTVVTDGKVYNMAGQYVGNSLEGLSKGMYIVNGKKYIVR